MEIEYNSPEELRKIYFDVTGKEARDENGQYYQDYCHWLENRAKIDIEQDVWNEIKKRINEYF